MSPRRRPPEVPDAHLAQAFGLRWSSDRPLTQFSAAHNDRPADVHVRRVQRLGARPGGVVVGNGLVFEDGARFTFGPTTFDTFGGGSVDWCGPDADVPVAFYGTVVAILLAWRGLVPLHASAVEIDDKAVLIAGPSGAGKSTLCHALVQAGARLVSDDLSALARVTGPGVPLLLPGRPEIRLVADSGPWEGKPKVLHGAVMTDPDRTVPVSTLLILGARTIAPGTAATHRALAAQIFRPRWMAALPLARERAATMLHAAARLTVCGAPSAAERPEIPVQQKVEFVLARMAGHVTRRMDTTASIAETSSSD